MGLEQLLSECLQQAEELFPGHTHPDTLKPFTITTNASKHAFVGVLFQMDSNREWYPCSYLSQLFNPAEQNYNIYDCELLAIIHRLETWHHYLYGSSFPVQVLTDHTAVTSISAFTLWGIQHFFWHQDPDDKHLPIFET